MTIKPKTRMMTAAALTVAGLALAMPQTHAQTGTDPSCPDYWVEGARPCKPLNPMTPQEELQLYHSRSEQRIRNYMEVMNCGRWSRDMRLGGSVRKANAGGGRVRCV